MHEITKSKLGDIEDYAITNTCKIENEGLI